MNKLCAINLLCRTNCFGKKNNLVPYEISNCCSDYDTVKIFILSGAPLSQVWKVLHLISYAPLPHPQFLNATRLNNDTIDVQTDRLIGIVSCAKTNQEDVNKLCFISGKKHSLQTEITRSEILSLCFTFLTIFCSIYFVLTQPHI